MLSSDEVAQLLGQDRALLDVGLREQKHEFLAAIAPDHVGRPEVGLDRLGDTPKHDVAGGMAVRVVDGLEMVDVDEGDREGSFMARPRSTSGGVLEEERPPVGDAGQQVDRGILRWVSVSAVAMPLMARPRRPSRPWPFAGA